MNVNDVDDALLDAIEKISRWWTLSRFRVAARLAWRVVILAVSLAIMFL